jgi:uncharacterized protein
MYFDKPGKENTEATLAIAAERAEQLGIDEIVVATTTGQTALMARKAMPQRKIIAVSYHAGFREPFKLTLDEQKREELRGEGIAVVWGTHALSGIERGISKKLPGAYPALLTSEILRLFGQGTKVAVEVSVMAADAGELRGKRIIAIGGSSAGADTALVLTPAYQSVFFDLKIHEIICKPNLY